MIRFTIGFALLVGLGALAAFIAGEPGTLSIVWQGQRIETSAAAGFLLFALASGLIALAILIIRRLRPSALLKAKQGRDREKGWQALAQGLIAVAAGDAKEAARLAHLAETKLKDPGKTLLLTAQASQLSGNKERAADSFARMLDTPETELLGLKGLLADAGRLDDAERAFPLAKRAVSIGPKTPWALDALFTLSARQSDWEEALATLTKAERAKVISSAEKRRREAVIHAAAAEVKQMDGNKESALRHAELAFKRDEALPENTARFASLLHDAGKARRVNKVLAQGFAAFPHPAIAEAARMLHLAQAPAQRLKAMEQIAGPLQDNVEAQAALADAAIAAQAWQKARDHLAAIPDHARTARIWSLVADLARQGDGDADAARDALMQAARAPSDAQWLCGSCGRRAADWSAICPTCHSVDSAEWRSGAGEAMAQGMTAPIANVVPISTPAQAPA
ncbi:MAG: heme biosynthesis protein HemY, partial [Alphaproteobacteria bacterium]